MRSRLPGYLLISAALALAGYAMVRHLGAGSLPVLRPVPRGERSVLFVTVDTTRADHLQPYGGAVPTPALQRLADTGILFERAYSVSPITLVAHTSLLSGLYPPRHGVRNNGIHFVSDAVETLAERLAPAGYRTAAFVSAAVLERRYGLDQGFEVFDDDLSRGRQRLPRMVPDRPAEATVDAARAWLDGLEPGEPYFLWVHLYDPHAAYSPPAPWRDRYRERLYDGEIAYMDDQIGRLLEHPLLRGEAEPVTLVVGDHGESLGEHGERTHAILAYDATLHVPWLLRVPGGPEGLRIEAPVSQVDVMPTLLDLLGMDAAPESDGRSRVPLLESGPAAAADEALYSEAYLAYYTYGWEKLRVLRRGRWKYIEAPRPELYDTIRDPRELADVASQDPGTAHDMGRDLREWLESKGGDEHAAELSLDADALDSLRALGYVAVGGAAPPRDVRPDPKDVIELHVGLERARRLSHDQLWEQAGEEIAAVLERDPGNLAALMALARNHLDRGQPAEAHAATARALGLDPRNPQLLTLMASVESQRGRPDQALELLDRLLESEPRHTEARLQRAQVLLQTGRAEEGRSAVREALAAEPHNPRVIATHARLVEMRDRDWPGAAARARQALERDPFLAEAWLTLGQALENQSRTEEALESYREGLKRVPDGAAFHASVGLLLARTGGDADAASHLREAIRLSSEMRPDLHVALGAWLAEHGRLEEAETEYERVLAVQPSHPGARNNRAIALFRTGRAPQARLELQRLVEEFPELADAHNNLAAVAVDDEDWEAARRHARSALELDERLPEAWNNLGIAEEELGESETAVTHYQRALEVEPRYWPARHNRGVLLAHIGRTAEAIRELTEVVRQFPGHPLSHLELGLLLADVDPDLARRHLNAFLRAAPRDDRAQEARSRLARLPEPREPRYGESQ